MTPSPQIKSAIGNAETFDKNNPSIIAKNNWFQLSKMSSHNYFYPTPESVEKAMRRGTRSNRIMGLLLDTCNSGAFDGGCRVWARAWAKILPNAKVVTIMSGSNNKNTPDHYGVLYEGKLFDGNGMFSSSDEWIDTFKKTEGISDNIKLWYEDHEVRSSEIPSGEDNKNIENGEKNLSHQFKKLVQKKKLPPIAEQIAFNNQNPIEKTTKQKESNNWFQLSKTAAPFYGNKNEEYATHDYHPEWDFEKR